MRQRRNGEEGSGKGFIHGDFIEGDRDGLRFTLGVRREGDDFFGKTDRIDGDLTLFADRAASFGFGQLQAARGDVKVTGENNSGRVDEDDFLTGNSIEGDRT